MTVPWSLRDLLADFHAKLEADLRSARTLAHPVDKGDASEAVWLDMLNQYLPRRYEARKGHVVDSNGSFSEQIDIIIHDRQYSPFVFGFKGTEIIPAESVYAVFEAKQSATAEHLSYARAKAASVRALHRTTLPIQTVDGIKEPKPLHSILAGLLTLTADWSPKMGATLRGHLESDKEIGRLDIGCIADAQLQAIGTVPMLDMRAYAARID
jgi:hypothetical protein